MSIHTGEVQARGEGFLTRLTNRLQQQRSRLLEAFGNLNSINDRVFGTQPAQECDGNGNKPTPVPASADMEIGFLLNDIDDVIRRLQGECQRTSSLI